MTGGIIITHAGFSLGLKEAVEMILGKQELLEAVVLREGNSMTDLKEAISEKIEAMKTEHIIFFVDLFGATPCNAASLLCAETGFPVITGVNMPVLFEFLARREESAPENIPEELKSVYEEAFHIIRQEDLLGQI